MAQRLPVWFMTAALLAIAAGALAVHVPAFDAGGLPGAWRPGPAELERLEKLAAQRLEALPPTAEWRLLAEEFMYANLAQAGREAPGAVRKMKLYARRFAGEARAFVATHSEAALLAVGTELARRFTAHLEPVGRALAAAAEPPAKWLAAHVEDEDLVALRALSGGFLERAVGAGMLGGRTPPDPAVLAVARTMYLQNFLAATGMAQPRTRITDRERAMVLAWKAEEAEHLSWERRVALAREAAVLDPDYPEEYVVGVLFALAGEDAAAREALLEALAAGQEPARAREWLIALRPLEWTANEER